MSVTCQVISKNRCSGILDGSSGRYEDLDILDLRDYLLNSCDNRIVHLHLIIVIPVIFLMF